MLLFLFRAEAADLAGCSKVYHEVMSLSQTKGERDSPFNFMQMLSYVEACNVVHMNH